jgi:starch synthase
MITPELAPVAKVGGLADVVTGLSKDLVKKGHQVEIMIPMFHSMRYDLIEHLEEAYEELWAPNYAEWLPEKVFAGTVEGIRCYFFTCGDRFNRDSIYGYDDDLYRFVHFNRSVMEFMLKSEKFPDIIHCHDWQTGMIPVMMYDLYNESGFDKTRVLFTIHNIEHQGHCWYGDDLLASVDMDCSSYFNFDRLQDNLKHEMINLLKAGIVYSNFVTTVSPTYCREIKFEEGKGLEATLNHHSGKLGGILNGLDFNYWNPATDPCLELNYDADSFEKKFASKKDLREKLGLADEYRPLVCCISRLVPQKGLDLIKHAIFYTLEMGGQFILLGSSPDEGINNSFREIAWHLSDNPNLYIEIGYNEDLAHKIYAGSDMLLVPSLFEPCGLTQLIALRYGTVPIVRNTGGLADTVQDVDYSGQGFASSNGYTFNDANCEGVESAMRRAFECWFYHGENFMKLARNGMRCDFSWDRSGNDYINIYNYIKVK